MYELGLEALAELLPVAAYGLGTLGFTTLGLLAEQTGIATLLAGGVTVSGVWMVAVGAVLLYAGVAYCGRELLAAAT
ncbi:MAG: hypothetical protein ABEJ57_01060 [Halobacteriaceae archaeon]